MKPIMFNTEMVKAILSGRKTVTRRLIKPQPCQNFKSYEEFCRNYGLHVYCDLCAFSPRRSKPYQPGDALYARETWAPLYPDLYSNDVVGYIYKADSCSVEDYDKKFPNGKDYQWKGIWQPSIYMPKEAARIFLRVTDVRVERLRLRLVDDLEAEGFDTTFGYYAALGCFADLWDSTIKKADLDKYGWDANPWVWVIEFERISKEEALKNA